MFLSISKLYLNQHETRYTDIAFSHTFTNALKCWSENLCIRQNIGTNSDAIFCINLKYFCTGNCIDIQERKVYSKSLTWLFWNLEMKFSQGSMKLFICKSWKLLLHYCIKINNLIISFETYIFTKHKFTWYLKNQCNRSN